MDITVAHLPDLSTERVLITGAGGGLGSALAAVFVAAGARVAVHARTIDSAEIAAQNVLTAARELGPELGSLGETVPVAADLARAGAAAELVDASITALGGTLTGVINCAGVQPVVPFQELQRAEWDEMLALNVSVPQEITLAAAPALQGGGWIINIASIEGTTPAPGHAHYAVSKAALLMQTRAAALELGAAGIRVNSVSPGLIARPGLETDWAEGVTSWCSKAPLGKLVEPQQVAAVCAFLASPAAAAITGQNLTVDCGMSVTPGW